MERIFCGAVSLGTSDLSPLEIANGINEALLEPLRHFQPFDRESGVYPLPLEDNPEFVEVP